jgi:asparagine synthase (glutamine-hydrolysing)
MCGIGAVIARDRAAVAGYDLAGMGEALSTRGPDGGDMWVGDGVGLVHRRLSIIDLAGGRQPMRSASGVAITFNGEIYNYREIFAEIGEYPYQTSSDTEAILAVYERYGIAGIRRLRGMYAFVLHDPTMGRTIAARDPFGIKPLVWRRTDDAVLVSSESKALDSAMGIERRPSADRLGELIDRHFVGAPRTAVHDTYKVAPGEVVELTADGRRTLDRLTPVRAPASAAPSDPAGLASVLDDTTRMHVRSDVPVGLFLSGGIDSACLLHLMHRAGLQSPQTYTVTFPGGPGADDARIAERLAADYGCRHRSIPFGEDDFWRVLPQLAVYLDDPTTDYALLPTWRLAEAASEDVKVVLSGEGGDEMFAGYGRYRRRIKQAIRSLRKRLMPDRDSARVLARPGSLPTLRGPETVLPETRGLSWLQRRQANDIAGWLPDDLLKKLDICLMAHGLEGRVPFTDREVADYALHLPDAAKIQGKAGKFLVKRWLAEQVPAAEPFRRKRGFTVPVASWLSPHAGTLADLLPRQPVVQDHMDADGVRSVMAAPEKNGLLAYALVLIATWWQGEAAAGVADREQLFDALSGWAR